MATEAMRAANIPDVRLGHNGGDITIGEQMHQAGFGIRQWNRGKSLVSCPSREQLYGYFEYTTRICFLVRTASTDILSTPCVTGKLGARKLFSAGPYLRNKYKIAMRISRESTTLQAYLVTAKSCGSLGITI